MEVVGLLAAETGCTFGFGMFQTIFTPNLLRQVAGLVYQPVGEILPADLPGAFYMGVRQPVGVVAGLAPWNAPLILSLRSIATPLAFGNTVVLKPSEESPITGGILYAEIFEAAGFPAGVFNVVTHAPGQAEPVVDEFMENPKVRRISFTGSTKTGRILAEKAARQLKRMVLELGGQNPLIVLGDADLEYAVNATAFGAFLHQGQICMSARRIIVERSISDEFVSRLVEKTNGLKAGDPREQDTIIGPVINEDALELIKTRVDDAVRLGGDVRPGGGDRDRRQRRSGRGACKRVGLRALVGNHHAGRRPWLRACAADRRRDRPCQRPARGRRATDAVRRRQGQRFRPVRRHGRRGRVHGASLGPGATRITSLPLLMEPRRQGASVSVHGR